MKVKGINKAKLREENPSLTEKELHNLYIRLRRQSNLEGYREYKKEYYQRKKKEQQKVVKPQEEKTSIIEVRDTIKRKDTYQDIRRIKSSKNFG